MKRVFLLVLIPAFLLLTGFMAYFYAGGYRNAKQGFRTSLSDFIFAKVFSCGRTMPFSKGSRPTRAISPDLVAMLFPLLKSIDVK